MGASKALKKYKIGVVLLILLLACLCVTSFSMAYANMFLKSNVFVTGEIAISLQDGKPVFDENGVLMEPGMTIVKDFYVKNMGTGDLFYNMYFDNITGLLAKHLIVILKDGNEILYNGIAADFTKDNAIEVKNILEVNRVKTFTIMVHLPSETANEVLEKEFRFDIVADAVQSVNNPDRLFE